MRPGLLPAIVVALCGCADHTPAEEAPAQTAAAVVDSVIPTEIALARFRTDLKEPAALGSGAPTRDALVRGVVRALAANDAEALEGLAVDVAEFAWLYYPTSPFAHPPYALPPGLTWFRLQEANRKAVFRALRAVGGRRLDPEGYTCAEKPTVQGENRIWSDCAVTVEVAGGEPTRLRLIDAILERAGRFAVISYGDHF